MDSHELVELNSKEHTYMIEKIIGRGTFGVVYLASKKSKPNEKFAIKRYFKNLHPNLCQMEISIIFYLNKKTDPSSNILKIVDGILDKNDIYLVTQYQPHQKFTDLYSDISLTNLKKYMYQLLLSLQVIHKAGVIHRDVKPDNFLFDYRTGNSMLIDFGLAEPDCDGKKWSEINHKCTDEDYFIIEELLKVTNHHKTGTKGFIAPEIIFKAQYQSTAVDIWAAGVIFLCFLAKRLPIFNLNRFTKIIDETIKEIEPLIITFGKDAIDAIAKKFKCYIYISDVFKKYELDDGIETLIVRKDIGEDGIKLLKGMLELDPDKRITANAGLKHPFFKDIL